MLHNGIPVSQSAYSFASAASRRMPAPDSFASSTLPPSATIHDLPSISVGGDGERGRHGGQMTSSRTWTTSSGDLGLLSEADEVDDRSPVLQEYNRLAKKHGVRLLVLEDFNEHGIVRVIPPGSMSTWTDHSKASNRESSDRRGWFQRLLRPYYHRPSPPPATAPGQRHVRHRRSVSDVAHKIIHARQDQSQPMEIQVMVRLSGKSALYLPSEYAPSVLILPTCVRAMAQHLSQNITTRGIFRIPGSVRIVNALFDYYCYMEPGNATISSTVRCANLPVHINASVHDVASTFKRMLSVIPGGVLGSLAVFDALVAVHSQLQGDPEYPRTKQTKVRARLIALAIGTIESQLRRQLVCAVFGLLSLIGRVAETTPREDQGGRPLPTGDLMGYSALGIVFGPLLVGDLLAQYSTTLANPSSGLLVFPLSPQKLRRDRKKGKVSTSCSSNEPSVNRILVANNITEMLIANWRDVVRQMKAMGIHYAKLSSSVNLRASTVKPSASAGIIMRKPRDWDAMKNRASFDSTDRDGSPDGLATRATRPRTRQNTSSSKLPMKPTVEILSPTAEESLVDFNSHEESREILAAPNNHSFAETPKVGSSSSLDLDQAQRVSSPSSSLRPTRLARSPQVSLSDVPPRTSSKQRSYNGRSQAYRTCSPLPKATPMPKMPTTQETWTERKRLLRESVQQGTWTDPVRGRKSERVNKTDHRDQSTQERGRRDFSAGSLSRIPRPSRSFSATRARAQTSETSPLNTMLKLTANQATFARTPKPANPFDTEDANSISSLLEDLTSSLRKEEESISRSRSQDQNALLEARAYLQKNGRDDDYFYPLASSARQSDALVRDPLPEQNLLAESSQPFYSPMRVPSTLLAHSLEHLSHHSSDSSRRRARPAKDSERRRPDPEEAEEQAKLEAGELWQGKRLSRVSALPTQSLTKFQADAHEQPLPLRLKREQGSGAMRRRRNEQPPIRPSMSEAASKRGAVKAIAARFETNDPVRDDTAGSSDGDEQVDVAGSSQLKVHEAMQPPAWAVRSSQSHSSLDKNVLPSLVRNYSTRAQPQGSSRARVSASISDTVASRAAVFQDGSRPNPSDDHGSGQSALKRPTMGSWKSTKNDAEVRALQRQLEEKNDKVIELQRQINILRTTQDQRASEELREAQAEIERWRERAEAAERKVKVFERFTAKLRGIRYAGDSQAGAGASNDSERLLRGSVETRDGLEQGGSAQSDIHSSSKVSLTDRDAEVNQSYDSAHTEDAGIVTARIRTCLHGPEDPPHSDFDGAGDWSLDQHSSGGEDESFETGEAHESIVEY